MRAEVNIYFCREKIKLFLQTNESSCSSSTSGDPDETSPLDECSFSEGCNHDSGTFLYSAVSPHSAGSLNKATNKPRRNSSLPSTTKHTLTQHYNSLAHRISRIRNSFNGTRNSEGKWGKCILKDVNSCKSTRDFIRFLN